MITMMKMMLSPEWQRDGGGGGGVGGDGDVVVKW